MTAILELLGFNHRGLKHSRALSRVGFEALAYVDGPRQPSWSLSLIFALESSPQESGRVFTDRHVGGDHTRVGGGAVLARDA